MSDFIKDGSGSARIAYVGNGNRLLTRAVTVTESGNANEIGDAYNINTGNITLTDAVDTPILYFKNNETKDYSIESIVLGVKPSTGGSTSDLPEITVIRNPTAGTTIDNENSVDILNSNRNYGSANEPEIVSYKGATGETITDGSDHLFIYGPTSGRVALSINEVLPQGTSLAVKFKPQASNTSQTVYCAIIGHVHTEEI